MVGFLYRHFKGGVYWVMDIGVHTQTQELMVLYKNIDDDSLLWCKPLGIFNEEVANGKCKCKRFEKIYNKV